MNAVFQQGSQSVGVVGSAGRLERQLRAECRFYKFGFGGLAAEKWPMSNLYAFSLEIHVLQVNNINPAQGSHEAYHC